MRYANMLWDFLQNQPFASDIRYTTKRDTAITGNFEVTILETGELIHSKKRGGGLPSTTESMHAIAIRIEDALEDM